MGGSPPRSLIDRRQALAILARGGALLVVACGTPYEGPACALAPILTSGEYWRDTPLRRSDLRWDSQPSEQTEPVPGIPLNLTLRLVTTTDEWCRPIRGARVDVWHCDADGVYSGVQDRGTGGRDFLRGYQVSDDFGEVRFVTVYPGWYPGRAVHIHAKVRLFDAYGDVTTETSTQLFFDDAVSDVVFGMAPYAVRGSRDTRNAEDPILRERTAPVVSITGSPGTGMQGRVMFGVRVGEIRRD
jgi:protocatechuate 3,4-dioxygenase beta subunit